MGNLLAQCQRCSIVECDLCNEVVPGIRRGAGPGPDTRAANGSGGSGPSGNNAHRGPAWAEGFATQDYQPSNMSEAELIQLAQQRSWIEAGLGPPQPPDEQGRQRLIDVADVARGPTSPRPLNDEEMLHQGMRASQMEEECRQRKELRDEQNFEYEESLRIDREKQEKLREEEKMRKELEEAEEKRYREEVEAKSKAKEEEEAKRAEIGGVVEDARKRLGDEPPADEANRVNVRVRTPEGKALKRAFRGTDVVGQIYDFVVVEGGEAMAAQAFRLITNMPRSVYEDRNISLQDAGLKGQCAMLVEVIESDEEEAKEAQPLSGEAAESPGGE